MCGQLVYSMYGIREAATNGEDHYANWLASLGFRRGKESVCVFWQAGKNITTVVHGDDFVSMGISKQLEWLRGEMGRVYESMHNSMVPRKDQAKELLVLDRKLKWES